MSTIEKRIVAALASDATSADLGALVAETEAAIIAADEAATRAREQALDPVAAPDAAKARQSMEDAAFTRDRLRTVLPRIQARLTEVEAAEYAARWEPDFRQVEVARDALAVELAETYPKVVGQVVDLFTRIKASDAEVGRINGAAPPGEHRRLHEVDLAARGLDHFTRDNPPIARDLKLLDWTCTSRLAYPPPTVPLAVLITPSVQGDPRQYSGDWWRVKEEEAGAQRERHEREAAEQEAKARENWRGPRWWEGERA